MAPIIPHNPKASGSSRHVGPSAAPTSALAVWKGGFPPRHCHSQVNKLVYMTRLHRSVWRFKRDRLNVLALKRPMLRQIYRTLAQDHHLFPKLKRVIDAWRDQTGEGSPLDFGAFGDFGRDLGQRTGEFDEASAPLRKVVAGYLLATQLKGLEQMDDDDDSPLDTGDQAMMEFFHDDLLAELKRVLDLMA